MSRCRRPGQPGLTLEKDYALGSDKRRWVIGVDEVGRGSLAGPVLVAAVAVNNRTITIPGVRDSKQLSFLQRDRLYKSLPTSGIYWTYAQVNAHTIDKIGIEKAIGSAMRQAVRALPVKGEVLIDGPRIPGHVKGSLSWQTYVRGDTYIYCIAAASIMAKVTRDRLMMGLAPNFPQYQWGNNKGYGTAFHRQAIKKYGPTPFHRRTFITHNTQANV